MRKFILAGLSVLSAGPARKTAGIRSPSPPRAILSREYPDVKLTRQKALFRPTDAPYSFPKNGWANDGHLKKILSTEARKRLGINEDYSQYKPRGHYTYYEFKQPMSQRLSDSEWQEMLGTGRLETSGWIGEIWGNNETLA